MINALTKNGRRTKISNIGEDLADLNGYGMVYLITQLIVAKKMWLWEIQQ